MRRAEKTRKKLQANEGDDGRGSEAEVRKGKLGRAMRLCAGGDVRTRGATTSRIKRRVGARSGGQAVPIANIRQPRRWSDERMGRVEGGVAGPGVSQRSGSDGEDGRGGVTGVWSRVEVVRVVLLVTGGGWWQTVGLVLGSGVCLGPGDVCAEGSVLLGGGGGWALERG